MTPLRVEFHPDAIAEASAAREWYEQRNPKAADSFVAELDRAVEKISRAPNIWPEYLYGTRQFIFRRFPYVAVFRADDEVAQIIAIAHASRRPGYWRDRQTN